MATALLKAWAGAFVLATIAIWVNGRELFSEFHWGVFAALSILFTIMVAAIVGLTHRWRIGIFSKPPESQ